MNYTYNDDFNNYFDNDFDLFSVARVVEFNIDDGLGSYLHVSHNGINGTGGVGTGLGDWSSMSWRTA
jgi:hypothetical protein